MIIGKLTLIKETLPHTFGDFRYVIEKDGVELARIPSTIRKDLIMVGVNRSDLFLEISSLIRNTINEPELNGDIDDISDMIAFKSI
jgi:hypothetical protein